MKKLPKDPLESAVAQLAKQGTELVACDVCGERVPKLTSTTKTYRAKLTASDGESPHGEAMLVVVTCQRHGQPPFFRAFRAVVMLAPFED